MADANHPQLDDPPSAIPNRALWALLALGFVLLFFVNFVLTAFYFNFVPQKL